MREVCMCEGGKYNTRIINYNCHHNSNAKKIYNLPLYTGVKNIFLHKCNIPPPQKPIETLFLNFVKMLGIKVFIIFLCINCI